MKFAWQSLNQLVNLNKISLETFQSKLILSGFEIDNRTIYSDKQNNIIDINITSNRIDTTSLIGMAKEISTIFNIKLKPPIFNIYKNILPIQKNYINENSQALISYIRLNYITNIQYQPIPPWIKKYININDSKTNNHNDLLKYIKNYIKIKWGNDIYFIDGNNIEILEAINKKNYLYIEKIINKNNNTIEKYNRRKNIILCMIIYNEINITHYHNHHFINAYNETVQLLCTYTQCNIGKSYEYNYNLKEKTIKIKLHKQYLQNILGPIINNKHKTLKIKQILNLLQQLKLQPKYNSKIFSIIVPIHRKKDLTRSIDIIEEIGRIYGFHLFIDKVPYKNKKGKMSNSRIIAQKIKIILRSLGLNEAINSSLVNNNINKKNFSSLKLYNPMTEEQTIIRNNLLDNLLVNYEYNMKQKNYLVEFFEIGKIFYEKNNKIYEDIEVSGLLYNPKYTRFNWEDKPQKITWFHAKGILENLFEKLQANIYWKIIPTKNLKEIQHIHHLLNTKKTIGIYNKFNHDIIGILSETNDLKYNNINNNLLPYLFNINLKKLSTTIKENNHLTHIIKPYSNYPCIVRDISIQLNSNCSLVKIKNIILNKYKNLIESINVVNSYYNIKSKLYFLCIRITYRSQNKTLDNFEINNITKEIEHKLEQTI